MFTHDNPIAYAGKTIVRIAALNELDPGLLRRFRVLCNQKGRRACFTAILIKTRGSAMSWKPISAARHD
jgi:hypothetical protein